MNDRRSLQLLAEQYNQVQTNQVLRDAFERDLKAFEQYIINEGLWDTIKQKGSQLVGGAKNALIQPLIKMVLDKLAQSDPEGYKKLQAAANDPAQLQALLNSPEVQQQQQALGQDVATTAESVEEELYEEYLNEAYSHLVDEAWIDPKTGKFVAPGTPGAVERKPGAPLSQTPNAIRKRAARAAASGKTPTPTTAPTAPTPTTVPVQQSTAVKAIGKVCDVVSRGTQALGQSKVGQAAGGFISKAVNWIKSHPKISLATALGLLVVTGGAAAIGAGGIAPLISSTLAAGGAGAAKGGIIGGVVGGAKDIYNQVKSGNVNKLGDIKWGQAGKAALKTGAKGAAIGAVAGAGGNVLGKAIHGVGDVGSGNYGKVAKPDDFLGDLSPGEKHQLGITGDQYNQPTSGVDKQNWYEIAHQKVIPGEPLSQQQLQAMKMATDMSPNNFSNYEQNLTPEQLKQFKDWSSHWSNQSAAATNAQRGADWGDKVDKLYPQYRTQVRR